MDTNCVFSSILTHILSLLCFMFGSVGISEATYSLAWTSTNMIVTGMHKYLRVLDLRGNKQNIFVSFNSF